MTRQGGCGPARVLAAFLIFFGTTTAFLPVPALPGVLQAAPGSGSPCFGSNGIDDSAIPRIVSSLRVAIIQPILTSTPYSQYKTGSFYAFFTKEQGVTANVTTDLNLLSTNITSGYGFNGGWGLSYGFYLFMTSQVAKNCGLVMGTNVKVLDDLNVSRGALFDAKKSPAFDVVVLPFSEYVTVDEFSAFENYVANGGTLIMMAHSLEYPVSYNTTTHMETLVYGHGWAFHGTYASKIPCNSNDYLYACPWAKNMTDWVGSGTCMASCYKTYRYNGSVVNRGDAIGGALYNEFGSVVFKSYHPHEEDRITNMTATSISSVFVNDSTNLIASYSHQFRKGTVVSMGVFGDDVVATDPSTEYFVLRGMTLGRTVPPLTTSSTVTTTTMPGGGVNLTTSIASTKSSSTSSLSSSNSSTQSAPPGISSASLALIGTVIVVIAIAGVAIGLRRRAPPKV